MLSAKFAFGRQQEPDRKSDRMEHNAVSGTDELEMSTSAKLAACVLVVKATEALKKRALQSKQHYRMKTISYSLLHFY